MVAVRCQQIYKSFGAPPRTSDVLAAIDCAVEEGEFVSLLGPSGCGKSTLLMMVAGLETVTRGRIYAGDRLVEAPLGDVGIVFQDPTLLPWRTTLANVLFPIDMRRRPCAADVERARGLLELVGLGHAAAAKPRQLSGGMRQRAAICRALVTDPRLLLMDEPFSALDAITRDDMSLVLLDVWERYRKTVLFVTHSIREAALLSDRVLVLGGKPAGIIEDLRIPFARPRTGALTTTHEFHDLCDHLHAQIHRAKALDPQALH
ncbi:MAG TPA: ABC transporter ATP-binding protein [Stellaceae bacterium]|jgi:NitT/TauT family transport system ATP-binding protein|nr:ABC transporter ATP-binding protein [Stellaceae bacterium]